MCVVRWKLCPCFLSSARRSARPYAEHAATRVTAAAVSNTRLKLVRSLAVCEESFPYPIPEPSAAPQVTVSRQPECVLVNISNYNGV
ncbi:hypothetical protein EYF80_058266 [Liparis tanakae]|uniref:Uncharacterized protein n=1 Tax=Liparis tanakae TaxID=230148 RepID=A0A4Z2ERZ2_9TELE|nr:hypothetical protein EYF80_058266 [Liparis tanakae]